MFDRFDANRIDKTEYGHGFYASDYGGDCVEYLSQAVYGSREAYIYEFEIPDQTFDDRWMVSREPATGRKIDRIIKALREDGRGELADTIANHPKREFDPNGPHDPDNLTQGQVMAWVGKGPKSMAFYQSAGIDGYTEGNYYCAFPHAEYGDFKIKQAYNVPEAEAQAKLEGLQDRRARREMEMRVHGELDAAREAKVDHIDKFHGTAMIGTKEDGTTYSVYDPDGDHDKYRAQERFSLKFGADSEGVWRVRDIVRDGSKAERAFKAQVLTSDDPEDRMRIADRVFRPDHAEIAGVRFELGGPAEGQVVDPAARMEPGNAAALDQMAKHYKTAAWHRIDFGQGPALQNAMLAGANGAAGAGATATGGDQGPRTQPRL
ncbi:MAG: hypothetical protein AAF213_08685 [Pseudomonadota bacterium]